MEFFTRRENEFFFFNFYDKKTLCNSVKKNSIAP